MIEELVEYKCYCGAFENNYNSHKKNSTSDKNELKIKLIKNSQIIDELTELTEGYLQHKIGLNLQNEKSSISNILNL